MSDVNQLMQRVTAILLAGGQSTRMGTDKAMLDWHGRPLWRQVRAVLADCGCRQVLVSGRPADLADGEESTPDVVAGLGPLAGIASVIGAQGDALSKDWLLVVPVDLPLLSPEALRWLCVQGFDAAGAHYDGHALPALLRNTVAFRQVLGTLLRETRPAARSAQALHAAIGSRAVALPPELAQALTNTNTPADWAAASAVPQPEPR